MKLLTTVAVILALSLTSTANRCTSGTVDLGNGKTLSKFTNEECAVGVTTCYMTEIRPKVHEMGCGACQPGDKKCKELPANPGLMA
jgi:hypothetical protein